METVFVRVDGDIAVRDRDALVGFERIGDTGDADRTARDLDIVLAGDTVVGGADVQRTQTVEDQVVLRKDNGVEWSYIPALANL